MKVCRLFFQHLFSFFMVAALALNISAPAFAQTSTTLVVSPAAAVARVCEEAQIAIRVENVEDLTAYNLQIRFDPGVVNVISVENGGFLDVGLNEPTNGFDNTAGTISWGVAQINSDTVQPKDGSGDLILINLQAVVPDQTIQITIEETSALVNWPAAMPIPFSVVNGTVETRTCDAPSITLSNNTVAENMPAGTNVGTLDMINEYDLAGFTYQLVDTASYPDNASFSISADQLNTAAAFNYEAKSIYQIKVRSTDSEGATFENIFTINILDRNDPPQATADAFTIAEDTILIDQLSAVDQDLDTLTYAKRSDPANGSVIIDPDGSFTYDPDDHFYGQDTFTFTVEDESGSSDWAAVTINVTGINDLPVADNQNLNTLEDTALGITLTGSDVETTTADLIFTVVSQPANGSLEGTSPDLTYHPVANFSGSDQFTFKVNDGEADSSTATISITVSPVNDAPTADAKDLTTAEDTPLAVLLTGSDVENDPLTFSVVTRPTNGSLSGTAPNLTYTPDLDYTGVDSFTYKANDSNLDSATATVTINVTALNDPPVLAAIGNRSVDEKTLLTFTASAVDVDLPGDTLTFSLANGSGAVPAGAAIDSTTGVFTWTPTEAQGYGLYTFDVCVSDGQAQDCETITVTVNEVNDAPTADAKDLTTAEDTPLSIVLTGSDVENDPLTFSVVTVPAHGSLSGDAPNLTYTPDLDYTGPDSFTYRAYDGDLYSPTVTVLITVTPVNDLPTAYDQNLTTPEDTALTITLTGSDVETPTAELTFAVLTQPANGTLEGTAPDLTFRPADDFFGSTSFTFQVTDADGASDTAVVNLTVTAVNDAPTADPKNLSTAEDTPLAIVLTGSDVENDPLTFSVVTGPANGSLSGAEPNLTYTPDLNYTGPDSFTYRAFDGYLYSESVTVSINVTGDNDVPVANAQDLSTPEDTALGITLTGSDVETPTANLVFTVLTHPANGSLEGTAPNLTYHPDADFNGSDQFTFQIYDGQDYSNIATVSLTVNPVNDRPVASDQLFTTDEEEAVSFTLNAADVDNAELIYTYLQNPANGTISGTAPNLIYTPDADYNGLDTFKYSASDGVLNTGVITVSFVVMPVNDAPTFTAGADQSVDEDAPLQTIAGWATAMSPGPANETGQTLAFHTSVDDPGLFSVLPQIDEDSGDLTFRPAPDANGTALVSVWLQDNGGSANGDDTSETHILTITINPVNDAPLARNVSASGWEGEALSFSLNGTDVDGDPLTYLWDTPSNGTISGTAPDLIFTPAADFFGEVVFNYTVTDTSSVTSAAAAVTLTIQPVNDAPDFTLGSDVSVPEDSGANTISGWLADLSAGPANESDQALTIHVDAADDDLFSVQPVIDPLSGDLSFTTAPNAYGTTLVSVYVVDDGGTEHGGQNTSATRTFTIELTPVNDAPLALNASFDTPEDQVVSVVLDGTDVDGDMLTYIKQSDPSNGYLSGGPKNYVYHPDPDFNGTDSFTFTVKDPSGVESAEATITIYVAAVNDVPTADSQNVSTLEDTALTIQLSGSDKEDDELTFHKNSEPAYGSLTIDSLTGEAVYTPHADYYGADRFSFYVNDGQANSSAVYVNITVTAVNDAPVAMPDTYDAEQNVTLVVSNAAALGVLANDSDPDGNGLTAILKDAPLHGQLTLNANGTFTYEPETNYVGPDSFTYYASDGELDSNVVTVTLNVLPGIPVTGPQYLYLPLVIR